MKTTKQLINEDNKLLTKFRYNPSYDITYSDLIRLRNLATTLFDFVKSRNLLKDFDNFRKEEYFKKYEEI